LITSGSYDILRGKVIAVLGYGNQGEAQAKVMRGNGLNVIVGNVNDEYRRRAERDGFETYDIPEAARRADVIMMLLPDEVQPPVFNEVVRAVGDREVVLDFASGYTSPLGSSGRRPPMT
jgi:Ketol-acid reductoisomerase